MGEAKSIVAGAARDIERAANVAKTALGALGVGLGAGYFASLIRGTIDAADRLNDLSKATSITVEHLAGLKLAAKQSGGDLDGIAQAINKLSVNMGKDAEKFKALGVSAQDPLEAFKQLSDVFVAIQDPQQRAAVMAEALGKSWASAAPLLAEGSANIEEMVKRGTQLAGTTKEMAEEADKFNDQMAELSTTLGSTTTRAVGGLLPGMNTIAQAMREAAKEGGLLLTVWVGLGGAMAHLLGMADAQKARARSNAVEDQLGVARKQLSAGTLNPEGASSSFFGFLIPDVKLGEAALARLRVTIDELEREKARLSLAVDTSRSPAPPVDQATAAAAAARAKKFLDDGKPKASGKTAADVLIELSGVSKDFAKDLALLYAEYQRGALGLEQYQGAVGKLIEKQGFAKDFARQHAEEIKRMTEASKAEFEAEQKRGAQMVEFVGEADKAIKQLEFEASLIGLSTAEREKAVAMRELENAFMKARKGLSDEEVASLEREKNAAKERLGALIDAKVARDEGHKASEAAAKEWKDTFERRQDSLTRTITDGLMRGFESGAKSGAEVVIDTLKNALKSAVFEPIIRAIVSPVSGAVTAATMGLFGGNSAASTAAAGAGLLSGGGGGGGGGLGGIGNLFSLGNTASSLFGASGFTAALAGDAFLPAALGASGAGSVGIGSTIGGALSGALPWVGGALAIGSLLGVFGGGGGPKASQIGLVPSGNNLEGVHFTQNNVTDSSWGEEYDRQFVSAFNALGPEGKAFLLRYSGQMWSASGPASAQSLVQQFVAPLLAQAQAMDQQTSASQSQALLTQLQGVGALGSGLQGWVDSQMVSPYLSPEERLAGARSLFDTARARAGAGDQDAGRALPGLASTLLGAGREVYASGSQFQALRAGVNDQLVQVLKENGNLLEQSFAQLPASIREAADDQINVLKKGFADLVERLNKIDQTLRMVGST